MSRDPWLLAAVLAYALNILGWTAFILWKGFA